MLQATLLVGEIQQAQSVRDGIDTLAGGRTDACLIGSSLSLQKATWFLETAKSVGLKKPCAFIAVAKTDNDCAQLIQSGADGALHLPLEPMSFTDMVQRSVERSRIRFGGALPLTSALEKSKVSAFHSQIARYEHAELSHIIEKLSDQLELLARELSRGRLKLKSNGQPSLATIDALRLAIESAFPSTSTASKIGTEDHRFVSAVVEWFIERIGTDRKHAADNLRKRLLGPPDRA